MRKAHSIALAVVVALVAVAPAQADPTSVRPTAVDQTGDAAAAAAALKARSEALNQQYGLGAEIIGQEQGRHLDPRLFGPSETTGGATVGGIVRQEEGRSGDSRLFTPAGSAPVLVVGPGQGFDVGDAVVGGAAAFALWLLAAAAVVLGGGRRARSEGAAG